MAKKPAVKDSNYTAVSNDSIRNRGRGPLPSPMSGENLEHTPLLPAEASRREVKYTSATKNEQSYQEPAVPHAGSTKSSVWHTYHGGTYVELSGKEQNEEFINIIHSTGARITIDTNGSITIKSFGDTNNITEGNMREVTAGTKDAVYEGGYTVHVQNGSCDIRSEGNLNISSGADMTLSAAGKLTMNIGDALDLAGSRVAITSRVDTLDLVSTGMTRIHSYGDMHMKSDGLMNKQSADEMNMQAGGNINADAPEIWWNSGKSSGADDGVVAAAPSEPVKSAYNDNTTSSASPSIGVTDLDDEGE